MKRQLKLTSKQNGTEKLSKATRSSSPHQEQLPDWLREALPRELGVHYFRVASAKAFIGENDGALEYLEKAIDNGWLYMDFLKGRKEFESMHGTPKWNRILEKIQEKTKKP